MQTHKRAAETVGRSNLKETTMTTVEILKHFEETINQIHAINEHILWDDLVSGAFMDDMLRALNSASDKNDICGAELADLITDYVCVNDHVALHFARQVERN